MMFCVEIRSIASEAVDFPSRGSRCSQLRVMPKKGKVKMIMIAMKVKVKTEVISIKMKVEVHRVELNFCLYAYKTLKVIHTE